jgi:hypothetical protein
MKLNRNKPKSSVFSTSGQQRSRPDKPLKENGQEDCIGCDYLTNGVVRSSSDIPV